MLEDKRRWNRRIAQYLKKRLGELRLDEVHDPRDARGLRWKLPTVLVTLMVGMVAGARSLLGVERTTSEMSAAMLRLLGISRRLPDTTARNVICALEPSEIRARIYTSVRVAHRRKALEPENLPFGIVAMDGKCTALPSCDDHYAQRQTTEGPLVGVVRTTTAALISSRAKVCLDAAPIPAQTNEMGHFATALNELCAAYGSLNLFRLVTYDAGACSRANAAHVRSKGLDYFFALKGTQPTLEAEATRLLAARLPITADARTEDVRSGNTVVRRVYITEEMNGYDDWDHLHTVVRVQSETRNTKGDVIAADDRYFLSSLVRSKLNDAQWLHVARLHWGVENNVHNTLDTVFMEDEHPWIEADPKGALVVMLLRRLALNLLVLFRTVTQRSDERRSIAWADLVHAVWLALVRTVAEDLHPTKKAAAAALA